MRDVTRVVNSPEILAKAGSYNVYNFQLNSLIFLGAVLKTSYFSEDNA